MTSLNAQIRNAQIRNAQIRHWINTGEHIIFLGYGHVASDVSVIKSGDFDETDAESVSGDFDETDAQSVSRDGSSSIVSSTASVSIVEELLASDNDILIPKQTKVDLAFQKGQHLWSQLVTSARALPAPALPAGINDLTIMLKDVPALPKALPRRGMLVGRPLWHVPDTLASRDNNGQNRHVDLEHLHGARKHFFLNYPTPVECRVSPQVALSDNNASAAPKDSSYPSGLLLLTLCWSYIFSVRFWELQGRRVLYTQHMLQPQPSSNMRNRLGHTIIHLGAYASPGLIRWLCALLAPKPGWSAQRGGFAPWTALCSGGAHFIITSDEATTLPPPKFGQAPSSDEAAELLIELGRLYGFDSVQHSGHRHDQLSPIVAGFMAALALPFYRAMELQPEFLLPTLQLNPSEMRPDPIRQYVADLRYYMTLSMHPTSVRSAIWSIFWQQDVECNVVSPWLSSALHVLRPLIDSGDLDILVKTLALRRPRVAPLWLGIFLLGSPRIPGYIIRYLSLSEERWGYATMASPDTVVSSWTGSPQSFLDQGTSRAYVGSNDSVSRADILRCRYSMRLQDVSSALLAWQPFGAVPKDMIELEVWPWLEQHFTRTYEHWVWYVKLGEGPALRNIQKGFRKDTGRFVEAVADSCLEVFHLDGVAERSPNANLQPSRDATRRMIKYCMEDAVGERDRELSMFPGARTHPWLKGWEGLEE